MYMYYRILPNYSFLNAMWMWFTYHIRFIFLVVGRMNVTISATEGFGILMAKQI